MVLAKQKIKKMGPQIFKKAHPYAIEFYSKGQFSQRENSSITGSIVIFKNGLTEDNYENN